MNTKEIKELVDLVAAHGLAGLEVERAGFRLRIEGPRNEGVQHVTYHAARGAEAALGSEVPVAAPRLEAPPEPPAPAAAPERVHLITAPIVGTFYRASNPDAEPFVKIGDVVEKGATLCIVEAMKLMNEIECDVAGTVMAVHPQNGQPVEYGEKLFTIQLR